MNIQNYINLENHLKICTMIKIESVLNFRRSFCCDGICIEIPFLICVDVGSFFISRKRSVIERL